MKKTTHSLGDELDHLLLLEPPLGLFRLLQVVHSAFQLCRHALHVLSRIVK